ncbi:dihydrolipoamide acetyltransferase family protein [Candidatus Palauibacter soopunensis]|uniref:dihydrolipoamide acetyltransferase family protein n=1 Tax=Candidatus Palauibacter soopunensis TaxID=3056739 RepID=UPI00238546DF|nr:dihydrolipoamide acetyltransferase family protein [Candidatus Palauibacter soopunensis]MDE2878847.1 dihydrolipoamide acetyltransferase family protein [Candidatus Palauibacter soopunensis]
MAQLSPTMEEGKLIEWKVAEGDAVAQGDVVAEIETDKANMDVEALGGGVLRKIIVQEGATVPVGALIGVIAEPDEAIDDLLAEAEAAGGDGPAEGPAEEPATAAVEPAATAVAPEPVAPVEVAADPAGAAPGGAAAVAGGRIKASPVARRMAAESGIALAGLTGSGPGGRIVKADIEAALAGGAPGVAPVPAPAPAPPTEAPLPPAPAPPPPGLEDRVEEASQMRKAIARRLGQSIGPVPHFFLTTEVDMGRALELRADLNARFADGKIGVTDLLLKATAEALNRHPAVNASWEENAIRYHGAVHLGIAVALDEGLITPVLRDAGRKGLRQISVEARDLIARARARKLAPEEYQGGTFSVSNLGMFEIDQFTAIINPPEAGILAIGQTVEKPVAVDGQVVVRKRMRVTMSCDHRVIDGASGAAFLGAFKAMLENPLEMIL